jgi:pyrimidine deaminase RibD-like protein
MSQNFFDQIDIAYLKQTVHLSRSAPLKMTAFSVGCVIVDADRSLVSTGYSRELGDDWHAEAVAIEKTRHTSIKLSECTLYSSLEPCSVRKSNKASCCSLILLHGFKRVVFGMREPLLFVDGRGIETLSSAGIEVTELNFMNSAVMEINAHLFIDLKRELNL